MLNKTNRKLYRSLRGEYKRYARRLKNTLFDCCCGKDAVNDSLSAECFYGHNIICFKLWCNTDIINRYFQMTERIQLQRNA